MRQGVLIIHRLLTGVKQEQPARSCTPPPGNVPLGQWGWWRKVAEACYSPFPLMSFLRGVNPRGGWFMCMGVGAQVTGEECMRANDLIATYLLGDE